MTVTRPSVSMRDMRSSLSVLLVALLSSCVALPPPVPVALPPGFDASAGRSLPIPDWALEVSTRVSGASPVAWAEAADGNRYTLASGRRGKDTSLLLVRQTPSHEWAIVWSRNRNNSGVELGLMVSGVNGGVYFVDDGRLVMVYDPESGAAFPCFGPLAPGLPSISAATPDENGDYLVRYIEPTTWPPSEPQFAWGVIRGGRLVPVLVPKDQ